MRTRFYLVSGLLLVLLCAAGICLLGGTLTVRTQIPVHSGSEFRVETERGESVIRVTDQRVENGRLALTVSAVSRGSDHLSVTYGKGVSWGTDIYVHVFGVMTEETFFGRCRGVWLIPASAAAYLFLLLLGTVRTYRADRRKNLYQYRNVRHLGLIVYLGFLLVCLIQLCFSFGGLDASVFTLLNSAKSFAMFTLPAAFLLSAVMTASNLRLMRKEGRNWRNMLGCILGILICLGILFPIVLGEWLQRTSVVVVHNIRGFALYADLFIEAMAGAIVAYLECVLIGTVLLSVAAARRVPPFDRDYILIHGCQVRPDGTLTRLLKGRADRAAEFARMQKEAAGRDIVFVPSGGQGPDEPVSEAEAIRNYLLGLGIPEDRILAEDRSMNTLENLRNCADLIRARGGGSIAFSTSNYHVFRTGLLASGLGLSVEGIGSPTKSYFWINAFVREFIATLRMEQKAHLRTVGILGLLILLMVGMTYVTNIL